MYPGSGVNGGAPGTQTASGIGGTGDNGGNNGSTGTLNIGGAGGDGQYDVAGGGGGGGYYGGGGGGGASNGSGVGGGGGGGGSSYVGALTGGTTSSSFHLGAGMIIFSYSFVSPLTSAVSTPSAVCTGGSATLSASGMTSYTWTPGSSGASSIIVSPSGTTSYTVEGTSPLGCYQISVLTVTVNGGPPVLTVNSTSTTICPTNTVILTATGALSYAWSGGVTNGVAFSPASTTMYTVVGANGCGSVTATQGITVTPLPVTAVAIPSVICEGGTASLTAAAALNYTWSPGPIYGAGVLVSPSSSVIYTVIGTTSICAGITTVALNVNPVPTLAVSASSGTICSGTSVNLQASGALSYSWQPGGLTGNSIAASPSISTLFVVTGINSFSCTSSANQVILVTASPTVNVVASNTLLCTGGTATLYASGAGSYNWSTGPTTSSLAISPVTNTSYSVIGTNTTTGCSASKAVNITVYTRTISISASTTICMGNTVTLVAGGATSYTWSNGPTGSQNIVTPTVTTLYQVNATTFTNNMYCLSNANTNVTVNPLPNVTAAATRTSICRNETVTLTATGAPDFLWSNLSDKPSFVFKGTSNITYSFTVTGTDANGCANTASVAVKVNACTGLEDLQQLSGVQIFPNPNNGAFTITFGSTPKNTVIRIYNSLGILVRSQEVSSENIQIDLEKEANGIYFVDFLQNDKSVQVTRIIKQ